MPTMIPKSGKANKIREKLLGTPPNEHEAYSRDPQIREADKRRVLLSLLNTAMNGGNMPPQDNQGMQ